MNVSEIRPDEYDRAAELWEASVRATHHFVTEADLDVFRPLVRASFGEIAQLAGLRTDDGLLIGFIGVEDGNVEMLFLDPAYRGQGGGSLLLEHAFASFAAVAVDVNEQNPQAIGFYERHGFRVVSRSEHDTTGKPYPILHMKR
ncbi:GNAT family N-acetyltransferase [Kribbella jiaozuonensis]|uniref:GNAT family N-acetyltransferase n=1 Tax=Kribbella jiaozuonensis TaxID=2575441 RepID=A0A4U3LZE4_9ACTN|nr:GNAT family N-acetyltransferase [Kribbella jiaozuonensis]TKK81571.1 GNAT family N-acetyltransferase [Kribbella jiaozuonensis]